MKRFLYLLLNHQLTSLQKNDAHNSLGVEQIVEPPETLKELWRRIPPDMPSIDEYLNPMKQWLYGQAHLGDYVLIQGDFGACYLMVGYAFSLRLVPVYSTTDRRAKEELTQDGSIKLVHRFKHHIYRLYGT